jgi:hypothetical protein
MHDMRSTVLGSSRTAGMDEGMTEDDLNTIRVKTMT